MWEKDTLATMTKYVINLNNLTVSKYQSKTLIKRVIMTNFNFVMKLAALANKEWHTSVVIK